MDWNARATRRQPGRISSREGAGGWILGREEVARAGNQRGKHVIYTRRIGGEKAPDSNVARAATTSFFVLFYFFFKKKKTKRTIGSEETSACEDGRKIDEFVVKKRKEKVS